LPSAVTPAEVEAVRKSCMVGERCGVAHTPSVLPAKPTPPLHLSVTSAAPTASPVLVVTTQCWLCVSHSLSICTLTLHNSLTPPPLPYPPAAHARGAGASHAPRLLNAEADVAESKGVLQ
jgi:hypothetical protein